MRIAIACLAATIIAGAAAPAHADQCAWLDDDSVARRAAAALAAADSVLAFCEPCGDPAPGAPAKVGRVGTRAVGDGFRELTLDDRGIDLAYTYVRSPGGGVYANLAALAGCPADGVSPTLTIAAATAAGVVIAPSLARVADDATRAAVAAPAGPGYLVIVTDPGTGVVTLLGVVVGALLAVQAVLVLAVLRRRRAHVPRATALADRGGGRERP
jgi:hypothetical protein